MRARNIKPGFFKCEDLAECPPLARILFVGLWCLADRDGRLEDRPKRIRAEVLPFDDGNVEEMLDILASQKFIVRYQSADGRKLIQIINFVKHQHPHVTERASELPPQQMRAPDNNGAITVQTPNNNGAKTPDSLILIPDSYNVRPSSDNGAKIEKPKTEEPAEFARFWETYPRREKRMRAVDSWKARLREGHRVEDLIAAATNYASHCRADRKETKHIMHPSTFLSSKLDFQDWIKPEKASEEQLLGMSPSQAALEAMDQSDLARGIMP